MTKEIKTFKYLINDYIYKINLKPESKYPDIVNIASGKRPKNQKEVLTRI